MFEIKLYQMEKRPNSTKIPSDSGTSFQCTCRDESSIINPIIEIQYPLAGIIPYNYAYVKDWNRYYRITDVVGCFGGIVRLYLQVDVLASFRAKIMLSYQYVTRSASSWNGDIVDHFYATRETTSQDSSDLEITAGGYTYDVMDVVNNTYVQNYFTTTIANGEFVIGVIGENDTGITYYGLKYNDFKTLLTNLMAYTPSNMNDVSTGIAKVLADPIQYITTCFWIPYAGKVWAI